MQFFFFKMDFNPAHHPIFLPGSPVRKTVWDDTTETKNDAVMNIEDIVVQIEDEVADEPEDEDTVTQREVAVFMKVKDALKLITGISSELHLLQESLKQLHTVISNGKFARYVKLRKYIRDIDKMKKSAENVCVVRSLFNERIARLRNRLCQQLKDTEAVITHEMQNVRLEFGYDIFS
jgi:hypothetical protein